MHLPLALFLSVCVSFAQAADLNIPETATKNGSFKTLVTLLGKAELVEILSGTGPFTVFAPTDAAFAKLDAEVVKCLQKDKYKEELTAVLTYHVANGKVESSALTNDQKVETLEGSKVTVTIADENVKINDANVKIPDVAATNGIIHAIDGVLIPTGNAGVEALIAECGTKSAADLNIPETAIKNGSFKTLVALLAKAEFEDLSGTGPFTVFAPTDAAFAKLDAEVVKCLQKDKYKEELTAVLTYHVANGKVESSALTNDQKVETLEGSKVTVTIADETVKINDATVKTADVAATNGIIHAIDGVLIPTGNADVKALIAECGTGSTSASAILGVAIPLIGMVAAVVAIV